MIIFLPDERPAGTLQWARNVSPVIPREGLAVQDSDGLCHANGDVPSNHAPSAPQAAQLALSMAGPAAKPQNASNALPNSSLERQSAISTGRSTGRPRTIPFIGTGAMPRRKEKPTHVGLSAERHQMHI
ncbi:hypothetical protein ACIBAC_41865 [Streptomyces sp. NPDC051362]|uniref:hypothetical protein n=1 Tax=Streptomyces sp. NPDC051362 TaxID=3365651 RepID=UPI0037A5529C